ncbi:hypothetical protein ACJ73_03026 [Blastomyces percursus]|uniref:Uncharacterized protein n=1 Tax=Blastomyces percursus TaxID=1658174 RepID=A0A1J9QAP1_9EURO|nr:hypothetical protein ACJ73_03026 [Blastomyces percursus]
MKVPTTLAPASSSHTMVGIIAITEYYQFLVDKGLLPASAIHYPPANGWPQLTDNYLTPLGKTPAVNRLIRHLPFVEYGDVETYNIYYHTVAVDYRTGDGISYGDFHNLEEDLGVDIPPYVLIYAKPARASGRCWMCFDTKRNTMTLFDFEYKLNRVGLGEVENLLEKDSVDGREKHCLIETYELDDFFERVKNVLAQDGNGSFL